MFGLLNNPIKQVLLYLRNIFDGNDIMPLFQNVLNASEPDTNISPTEIPWLSQELKIAQKNVNWWLIVEPLATVMGKIS